MSPNHTIFTPKRLWALLTFQMSIWAMLELSRLLHIITISVMYAEAIKTSGYILAFTVLLWLSFGVAREYRNTFCLNLAWHLMTLFSAIFIIRILVTTRLVNLFSPGYYHGPIYGLLLHITVFFSKGAFIISIALMCYAYIKAGLGFHIKKRDFMLIIGVLIMLLLLMIYRNNLSQAQSPYEISRYLQLLAQFQNAMMAIVAIILHRITVQMAGGKLETPLNFLILHAIGSSILVLSEVLTAAHPTMLNPTIAFNEDLGWQFIFWCPAIAASYRTQLTSEVAREIELFDSAGSIPFQTNFHTKS